MSRAPYDKKKQASGQFTVLFQGEDNLPESLLPYKKTLIQLFALNALPHPCVEEIQCLKTSLLQLLYLIYPLQHRLFHLT